MKVTNLEFGLTLTARERHGRSRGEADRFSLGSGSHAFALQGNGHRLIICRPFSKGPGIAGQGGHSRSGGQGVPPPQTPSSPGRASRR